MDPSTSSTPSPLQAESPQPLPPNSNDPPRKSKKALIITLAVAGVVVIIGLIAWLIFAMQNKGPSNTKNTGDTSLYYDRPGYDRKDLGPSIGDPLAIVVTPKNKTQELTDGTKVIPACSVLGLKELTDQGFTLLANDFGYPVQQNRLSTSGEAAFGADPAQMPLSDATLSCSYGFNDSQSVSATVNQDFTVKPSAVDSWVNSLKFQPSAAVDDYQVSKREKDGSISYVLRKGTDTIYLRLDKIDARKAEALMKLAVKNLKSFDTTPTGASEITYETPTFTEKYAKACELVDNATMKALSGNNASPLVQEFWPTATGVADFSKVSDYKTKSNYLRNECVYVANKPDYKTLVGNQKNTLRVTTMSYENEEAAKNGLQYYSAGEGNDTVQAVEAVGDEAVVYTTKDGENSLALRQGKVVVELLYDHARQFADPTLGDLKTYAKKLSPTAQNIVTKLKSS